MAVKNMLKKHASSKKRSPGVKKYKKNFSKKSDKIVHKPKQKPTTLVAQDVQFARSLASNDKKKREKTLKKLRVWLSVRSKTDFAFTEIDLMRLWKGLFYCMWMSDKPLVQEDLAESISQLVHSFDTLEMSILYTKCAFNTLSTEWFGIDQYRLDKFHMLVRRILRQTFFMCKKQSWNLEWVKSVAKVIEDILLNEKCALGFSFHITDIFCEELAKVSEGLIEETAVAEFLRPFVINLATKSDNRQIRHTVKQVFRYLIFQSDVGMDYKEKFEAWSKAGFPTGKIDAMERVEVSDEENEEMEMIDEEIPEVKERPLDPRAGRVDVIIPQLPFDPKEIVKLLEEYKLSPSSTPKTRKHMSILSSEFNEIAKGNMPLGIKEVNIPKRKHSVLNPTKAAKRLLEFEDDLYERKKQKKAKKSGKIPVVKEKKSRVKKNKVKSPEKTPETQEKTETPAKKEELKSPVKAVKSAETPTPIKKQKLKTPEKVSVAAETTTPSPKKKKLKTPEKATPLKNNKVKTLSKSPLVSGATPPTKKEKLVTPVNTPVVLETTPGVKKSKLKSPKNKTVSETTPLAKKEKSKTPEKIPTASETKTSKKETFKTPVKTPLAMEASSSAKKKVTIALENNTAQQTSEYFRKLRMSPQLPFDGSKKPPPGVLKKGFVLSPINPWYRRSLL